MTEPLIALLDKSTRFSPEALVGAAREEWPEAHWAPSDGTYPELGAGWLIVSRGAQHLSVSFLPGGDGLLAKGDDDLCAEFISWLTRQVSVPAEQLVVVEWANVVVSLSPNMSANDVQRLRGT